MPQTAAAPKPCLQPKRGSQAWSPYAKFTYHNYSVVDVRQSEESS